MVVAPGSVLAPRWSPSGEWLAYREGVDLWVVRRDGTHRQRLAGHAAPGYYPDAYAWSPTVDALAVLNTPGVRVWWFSGTAAAIGHHRAARRWARRNTVERGVVTRRHVAGDLDGAPHAGRSQGVRRRRLALARGRRLHAGRADNLRAAQAVAAARVHARPDDYPIGVTTFGFDNGDVVFWVDSVGSSSIEMDGLTAEGDLRSTADLR